MPNFGQVLNRPISTHPPPPCWSRGPAASPPFPARPVGLRRERSSGGVCRDGTGLPGRVQELAGHGRWAAPALFSSSFFWGWDTGDGRLEHSFFLGGTLVLVGLKGTKHFGGALKRHSHQPLRVPDFLAEVAVWGCDPS